MLQTKPKPCKWCGSLWHQSWRCIKRPDGPNLKRLKQEGKKAATWLQARKQWFRDHPPDEAGLYYCYIPWCGKPLSRKAKPDMPWVEPVTLDHILSRSRRPDLFDDPDNLAPCCSYHNKDKGSKSLDEYIETSSP